MVKNLPAIYKTWVCSPGREEPLEKEMATHSRILAGRIHGQRGLSGYSHRVEKESEWLTLSLRTIILVLSNLIEIWNIY